VKSITILFFFFQIDVHGIDTVKEIFIHMDIDYNYNRSVIYMG